MSETSETQRILQQLRGNLEAMGVPATAADYEGLVAKGFLDRVANFEASLAAVSAFRLPDYLGVPLDRDLTPGSAESAPQVQSAPPPSGSLPSLLTVAGQLQAGQRSPVELTEESLARIAAVDPQLNAFQQLFADQALEAAAQAEREIAAGQYRGPLHGVPVAIKDLLDYQGTVTSAGSRILAENWAAEDSFAVERLKAAGAIIVGRTRMSEFAYSPGSNNAHYGATHNPWNLAHDSGGSSSGSGAAVAAGAVFAALGSDTGGSIRIPASYCGIVGLKPTYGRVSLHGAVTLSWSLDHLGPLTRTVADAALVLAALVGEDRRDERTRGAPPLSPIDLTAGVAGLRIGVLEEDGGGALGSDEMLAASHAAVAALEAAGATLVPIRLPQLESLRSISGAILAMEALAFHLNWLRFRLDDYGEFPRQRLLAAFVYGPGSFVRAQQSRAAIRQECAALFEQIDLLATPSQPHTAPLLATPGSTRYTNPFNVLGWPAISLPIGLASDGLPLGLQLVGKPWDEATVLRAAATLEQAFPPLGTPTGLA